MIPNKKTMLGKTTKGVVEEEVCSDTSVCSTDEEEPLFVTKKDTGGLKHSSCHRQMVCNCREIKAALFTIVGMALITFLVPKWYVRKYSYNLLPEIVKGEYQCDYWGRDDDQFDRRDLAKMKNRYESGATVLLKGTCTNSRKFTVPLSIVSSSVYWIEEEIEGKQGSSDYPSYLSHKLVSAASNTPLMTFLCPDEYGVANCEPCTIAVNSICSADHNDSLFLLHGF